MDAEAAAESQAQADAEIDDDPNGFNENGEQEEDNFEGEDAGGDDEFGEVALEEGDQRGCVDVWRGQVEASAPDDF